MDPLDRREREELLRAAVLAGNEDAWRTWYDETFDDLYRYVRWRSGGRKDWADEIVQDTWLTAVRRVRRFDPKKGSFLAWLRGIAANLLRNELRKRLRAPRFQQPLAEQAGDARQDNATQADQHRAEEIAAALDALSEREEAVLRAKYLDGLSVAEIAAARGETTKAIESLLSRARQAFRKAYRGDESGAQNIELGDKGTSLPSPAGGRGAGGEGSER